MYKIMPLIDLERAMNQMRRCSVLLASAAYGFTEGSSSIMGALRDAEYLLELARSELQASIAAAEDCPEGGEGRGQSH